MKIEVEKLLVTYRDFKLEIEDLSIPCGITLLIGPNGAGKTTFMESMFGLRRADVHSISIDGEKLKFPLDIKIKEKLGFMPSIPLIHKRKSINYHKKLWSILYPDFSEGRFYEILKRFKLERKKRAVELSSGERRMFFFTLQISFSPEIFILDEPFAFLDINQARRMLEITMEYAKENPDATILISSHLIKYLKEYNFYTLIIRDGKIIREGIIEEDYENFF